MESAEIIKVVMGASSFLGLAGLVAYLYFTIQVNRAEASVRRSLEGESLFNAEQVLEILSQFSDSDSRLKALKTLTNYDSAKAASLLQKVEGNIDGVQLARTSAKSSQNAAIITAVVFLILTAAALVYTLVSPKSALPHAGIDGAQVPEAPGPLGNKDNGNADTSKRSTDPIAPEPSQKQTVSPAAQEPTALNSKEAKARTLYSAAIQSWKEKGDLAKAIEMCRQSAQLEQEYSTDKNCQEIKKEGEAVNLK